jgi:hypothetical protein
MGDPICGVYIEFRDREEAEDFLSRLNGILPEDFFDRIRSAVDEMLRHVPQRRPTDAEMDDLRAQGWEVNRIPFRHGNCT